ncbi:hypothetical protein TC41_0318 [Alicyclobacillus acidocaldarius subsp. acidocaldarius Tc-4-1]|uniref:Uncharacterized protein n=1 Tax=Alicyclobacillus acidocaldarius (strain Tc-4-1) TaxID=1048834 RepID=F8IK98_ALIAT|nr:hypothetical protein TC41_0318 [Alicyclobacillus acidocaldarius subsp. acidocaldarius Tc-4-1]
MAGMLVGACAITDGIGFFRCDSGETFAFVTAGLKLTQ